MPNLTWVLLFLKIQPGNTGYLLQEDSLDNASSVISDACGWWILGKLTKLQVHWEQFSGVRDPRGMARHCPWVPSGGGWGSSCEQVGGTSNKELREAASGKPEGRQRCPHDLFGFRSKEKQGPDTKILWEWCPGRQSEWDPRVRYKFGGRGWWRLVSVWFLGCI